MVRYSIAACNYNMVETLERSLRSILDQVDDEFEVVVVDGGSDDGSVDLLESLATEYGALRVLSLPPDESRMLGADRQRAVQAAEGEYVLTQFDVDDVYEPVIEDFVDLYTQLESQLDFRFYLSGDGLNMAPASLLTDVPYRNLPTAEDRDLWRRLFERNAILWLDHDPVVREIGYGKTLLDELRRDFSNKVADAQVGIGFASCILWSFRQSDHEIMERHRSSVGRPVKTLYDLATHPIAHACAVDRPSFDTPEAYRRRGALEAAIGSSRRTVSEIEAAFDVEVDRDRLSDAGRSRLCLDPE